ncbi:type I restriction enzyme HsdR N-terminal domain-containing protein [Halalkalibaculum sp. DA3122]|uniref:type I restriction enzyme HsdR N-terminal domain-containing protein n=1 Tax=Halalkalibaculum sp. DA3122 TaxID=3373607 RepID=UPI0037544AE2
MSSIAHNHYPKMVWRDGVRSLWNPIHKKTLKNRPEERVRLRIIEALVEAGWSRHRISTEEALRSREQKTRRTDIICYDQEFNPKILVECKAERVPISAGVAEQTARYNRAVNAPYLLMSNGLTDCWYRIPGQGKPDRLESVPSLLDIPAQPPPREYTYWKERGFTGEKTTDSTLRNWLTSVLNSLWNSNRGEIRYINFSNSPSELPMEHYFRIFQLNQGRVALGIQNTPFGGTRLLAVINRENQNVGLIDLNLDLVATETSPNATIYSETKTQNFDLHAHAPFKLDAEPDPETISKLPAHLDALFDELV